MVSRRKPRRAQGLREVRLVLPDARSRTVRRRIARQVARLRRKDEQDALAWVESISEFDTAR